MDIGIHTEFSKPSQFMVDVPVGLHKLWKESQGLSKQQEGAFGSIRHMSIHGLFYDLLLQHIAQRMKEESAMLGALIALGGGLLGAAVDTALIWLMGKLEEGAEFLGDLGQAMNDVEADIRAFHEKLGSYEGTGPENEYIYNPIIAGWHENPFYKGEDGELDPGMVHARQDTVIHTLTVTIDEQGNKTEEYAARIMSANANLVGSVDIGTSEHERQIHEASHDPDLKGMVSSMEEIGLMMTRVDWPMALANFWFNAYMASPNFQAWLAAKQAELAGG